MNKCTGIMGRIFGHKWEIKRELIQPTRQVGNIVFTVGQFYLMEHAKCQRCGAVTGEKK